MTLASPGGRCWAVSAERQREILVLSAQQQGNICTPRGSCMDMPSGTTTHITETGSTAPIRSPRAVFELAAAGYGGTRFTKTRTACAYDRVHMTAGRKSLGGAAASALRRFLNCDRYRKLAAGPAQNGTLSAWPRAGAGTIHRGVDRVEDAGHSFRSLNPATATNHAKERLSESKLLDKIYRADRRPRYAYGGSGSYLFFVLVSLAVYLILMPSFQSNRPQRLPHPPAGWHSCPCVVSGPSCDGSKECYDRGACTCASQRGHPPPGFTSHRFFPGLLKFPVPSWLFSYGPYTVLGAEAAIAKKPRVEDRRNGSDSQEVGWPPEAFPPLAGPDSQKTARNSGERTQISPPVGDEFVASLVSTSLIWLTGSVLRRKLEGTPLHADSMRLHQVRVLSAAEDIEGSVSEENRDAASGQTSSRTGRGNIDPAGSLFVNSKADSLAAGKTRGASEPTPSVGKNAGPQTPESVARVRQRGLQAHAVGEKEQQAKEIELAQRPESGPAHNSTLRAASLAAGDIDVDKGAVAPLPSLQRSLSRFSVTEGATAFRAVIPGEFRRRSGPGDTPFAQSRTTGLVSGTFGTSEQGQPAKETAGTAGPTVFDEANTPATTAGYSREEERKWSEPAEPSAEQKGSSSSKSKRSESSAEVPDGEEQLLAAVPGERGNFGTSHMIQNIDENSVGDSGGTNMFPRPSDSSRELSGLPTHSGNEDLDNGALPTNVPDDQHRQGGGGERLSLERRNFENATANPVTPVVRDEEYSSELLETPFPPVVPRSQPHIPLLPAEKDPRDSPLYLFLSKVRRPDRPRYRQRQTEFQDVWHPLTFSDVAEHEHAQDRHSPLSGTRTGQGATLWNLGFSEERVPQPYGPGNHISRETRNAAVESTFSGLAGIRNSRLGWKQAYVRPGLGAAEASDPVANDWDPEKSPKRLGGAPLVDFSPEELARMKTEPIESSTHAPGRESVTPSPSVWRPSMLKQRPEDPLSEDGREHPWDSFHVTRQLRRTGENAGGADVDAREGGELLFDDLMQIPTPVPHVAAELLSSANPDSSEGI